MAYWFKTKLYEKGVFNLEIRQLDNFNRITLSTKIRKEIGADRNTIFKVEVVNGSVILKPVEIVEKN